MIRGYAPSLRAFIVTKAAPTCLTLLKYLDRSAPIDRQKPLVAGPSRFEKLPTEIRHMILGFVLHQGTIHISRQNTSYLFWKKSRLANQGQSQVLRVCRLFEREGAPILYQENTIRICGADLASFDLEILQRIGKKNVALLRCLEVHELRKSCHDRIVTNISDMTRHNPELSGLHSLIFLAADSRFPGEKSEHLWDGSYIVKPTSILPHLTRMIVSGDDVALAVGRTTTVNGVSLGPHPLTT